MTLTRVPFAAGMLHLADASWAVFFVAGYYLAAQWRWMLPSLMALATGIDLIVTQHMGISDYCMTPAYAFLVPTHAALWLGGAWFASHAKPQASSLLTLFTASFAAISVAFLLSNGSFYWLGNRGAAPSMDGWISNMAIWFPTFLGVTMAYIGIAAAIHVIATQALGIRVVQRLRD